MHTKTRTKPPKCVDLNFTFIANFNQKEFNMSRIIRQGRRTLPMAKEAKPTWEGTCKGSLGLYSFYMKDLGSAGFSNVQPTLMCRAPKTNGPSPLQHIFVIIIRNLIRTNFLKTSWKCSFLSYISKHFSRWHPGASPPPPLYGVGLSDLRMCS